MHLRPARRLAAAGVFLLVGSSLVVPAAGHAADLGVHHARTDARVADRTVKVAVDSERIDDGGPGQASIRVRSSNDDPVLAGEDDHSVEFRCESALQQVLCFAIDGDTSAPPPVPAP